MSLQLYAQPYDLDAAGFYFSTFEEYESKSADLLNCHGYPVEEFEVQFIDGLEAPPIDPNQCELEEWVDCYDQYQGLSPEEIVAVKWLVERGKSFRDALDQHGEVQVFHGSASDYATELVHDCHDLPDFALQYFDYDSFANDLKYGGDVECLGNGYLVTNPHDF
ncbi:antirestriction protein ArdA [Parahaliea mediterranea]|uniref:antirestriction protein ArdA n=1 Tax=Parahaliea mediterranea TaxID=651086 RepID=UPI0019D445A5|nr:antirestriction protein ArdA [Parahaliea mediterranea]